MRPEQSTTTKPQLPGWPAALTKTMAGQYIGMSPRWIDMEIAAGRFIRAMKFGRASRWRREDLDAWLAEQADKQA